MATIENTQALTDIFGYWPSFHDAEVLSLHLDRQGQDGYFGPTLDTQVHVFEMTSQVDPGDFYVLRHHTLVTLRFLQVDQFRAEEFNHQNALWGLDISDISDRQMEHIKFQVRFSSPYGLDMAYVCKAVRVVAAEGYGIGSSASPSGQSACHQVTSWRWSPPARGPRSI